jgi:ABC-2 type transport system permease protein
MTSTRFMTLLQREWMQHHKGWLIVMLTAPVLLLLAMPFGKVDMDGVQLPSTLLAAAVVGMTTLGVWAITWLVTSFQLPGLARRDNQDRSIEFWLSLPGSHTESISATLLMHTVFVSVLALALGAAMGLVMATAVVTKVMGFGALADVSWWSLGVATIAGLLRVSLGAVLFSLWLAPIYLIMMAAAAWLKRAGVPVVIAVVVIAGNVLQKVYGNPIVWKLLERQFDGASRALFDATHTLRDGEPVKAEVMEMFNGFAGWAAQDAWAAVMTLASPHFIGGLVVAAACFGLLILHRRSAH